MTDKNLILFVGGAVVVLVILGFYSQGNSQAAPAPSATDASAAVGSNPLGAASGTLNSNGDPLGGLGATGAN
jgi:hypothetical protein